MMKAVVIFLAVILVMAIFNGILGAALDIQMVFWKRIVYNLGQQLSGVVCVLALIRLRYFMMKGKSNV